MSERSRTLALALVMGLAGGSVRSLFEPRRADAKDPKTVSAEEFRLVDASGKTTAQLARSGEGSPVLFFFDKDGHARLQVGLYADGGGLVGLFDAKGQATELLRTAGSQGSPVIVLKAGGKDRMILGLDMEKAGQEPFIEYFEEKGEKKELIPRK
ncbi:hypothetical protein HY251_17200 [bacterium]|nr:hypothetical protein [bacterium]